MEVQRALRRYVRPRIALRWMTIDATPSLPTDGETVAEAVAYAVAERLGVARERSNQALQRIGFANERLRKRALTFGGTANRAKS
jgi:hypothetical protein